MESLINYHNSKRLLMLLALTSCCLLSCKKYLDEKPQQNLVVPSTVGDLQALLDNNNIANSNPTTELPADNYYITTGDWQTLLADVDYSFDALSYVWDNTVIYGNGNWDGNYMGSIYFSNIVLDLLPTITDGTQPARNAIEGSALFLRATAFQELAQLYCRPYSSSAVTDPGIVLKLTSNISEPIVRSTVQQTYDRIITDLKQAVNLLPTATAFPTRPTKAAAYGELARTYLCMRDYTNAGIYANLCLQQDSSLMNYNNLVPVGNPPVPNFNTEVIFHHEQAAIAILATYAKIDSVLYQSYATNDLRKTVFFQPNTGANAGTYKFQGSYYGSIEPTGVFSGITTDEMYLTRAECYARASNIAAAMADLNTLLVTRWKTGTYTQVTAIDASDALNKILIERRKELVFRGQRWSDLRRLNLEGANITLKRIINNITYTLPPNDNRWVMLIPLSTINQSHVEQNPR